MTIQQTRNAILGYFKTIYGNDRVVFEDLSSMPVKPSVSALKPTFVTLSLTNVKENYFDIEKPYSAVGSTDVKVKYIPSQGILAANLWTLGTNIASGNSAPIWDDDSCQQLMKFTNMLRTDTFMQRLVTDDINIIPMTDIQSVPQQLNGMTFQYRAYTQYRIYFTQSVSSSQYSMADDYFTSAEYSEE